jgi:hypothetical protein
MSSTFQAVGFERLYIKGVLWNLADFKGPKGDDQKSSVVGPDGDEGDDGGFEFNTINTTTVTAKVVMPDPATVSYNGLILKTNGEFIETPNNGAVPVHNHQDNFVGNFYNNGKPQSMRFSKNGNRWVI